MPAIELELPDDWRQSRRSLTIRDYLDLDDLLRSYIHQSESKWADAVRWLACYDLFYLVSRLSTAAGAVNVSTGIPLFNRPFVLERCRDIEEREHLAADIYGRGMVKSFTKTRMRNIQRVFVNPESTGIIFSYDRNAAKKHLRAVDEELTKNEVLKRLFDDVLYWNPRDSKTGSPTWSREPTRTTWSSPPQERPTYSTAPRGR